MFDLMYALEQARGTNVDVLLLATTHEGGLGALELERGRVSRGKISDRGRKAKRGSRGRVVWTNVDVGPELDLNVGLLALLGLNNGLVDLLLGSLVNRLDLVTDKHQKSPIVESPMLGAVNDVRASKSDGMQSRAEPSCANDGEPLTS